MSQIIEDNQDYFNSAQQLIKEHENDVNIFKNKMDLLCKHTFVVTIGPYKDIQITNKFLKYSTNNALETTSMRKHFIKTDMISKLIDMINLKKPIINHCIYYETYDHESILISDSNVLDEYVIKKDSYGGYKYIISKNNLLTVLKSIEALV